MEACLCVLFDDALEEVGLFEVSEVKYNFLVLLKLGPALEHRRHVLAQTEHLMSK